MRNDEWSEKYLKFESEEKDMSLERRVEYVDGEEDESIYLDAM
jgi:hypothetical protein